jgi:hypothetical protein
VQGTAFAGEEQKLMVAPGTAMTMLLLTPGTVVVLCVGTESPKRTPWARHIPENNRKTMRCFMGYGIPKSSLRTRLEDGPTPKSDTKVSSFEFMAFTFDIAERAKAPTSGLNTA